MVALTRERAGTRARSRAPGGERDITIGTIGGDHSESLQASLRTYWDADAATYDRAASHVPRSAAVNAAWAAALLRLLPPPPARILDAGAGTGFLSLGLAQLGYRVTALDSAPAMLERLAGKAREAGLAVETAHADAASPPDGPFDAVVQRHLIWTLPEPGQVLEAWRVAAPHGRLVLFESMWGSTADLGEQLRNRGRHLVRRLQGQAGDHHAAYQPQWQAALPFGTGTTPEALAGLVAASTWGPPCLYRLRDIEWAILTTLGPWERIFGTSPRFALTAGQGAGR